MNNRIRDHHNGSGEPPLERTVAGRGSYDEIT